LPSCQWRHGLLCPLLCCAVIREGIEDVVLSKRRFTYEQEISADPLNYDAWFDYIKLEESTGDLERIREVRTQQQQQQPRGAGQVTQESSADWI
jgi:hypothetical protein